MKQQIQVADFHCDALYKLLVNDQLNFSGHQAENTANVALDVTWERLQDAGSVLQTFAIYIPEHLSGGMKPILQSVDLFMRHIVSQPSIAFVRSRKELREAAQANQTCALLSLEGADGLQGDLSALRLLYYLGVRALGMTWNYANWAADGVMEKRGGGLTRKGKMLVEQCNAIGIILDVTHLSDQSFWETIDCTTKPLLASHSNCRSICSHPRNLTDEQITAILAVGGVIGVNYVPAFVTSKAQARVSDVVRHIEHLCSLGAEQAIMLGSDFDGIDEHVEGLSHPGEVWRLRNQLLQLYSEEQVHGFFSKNVLRFLEQNLPE